MGAFQHNECELCGESSGERFRDELLPCPHCGGDIVVANKILKQKDKEIWYFRFFIIFLIFIVCIIIGYLN